MRKTIQALLALSLLIILWLPSISAAAQAGDGISITGETVEVGDQTQILVTVNALSASNVRGISFKIKYDAACLKPNGFQSLVLNLNNNSMKQEEGLVDGIFTSTESLPANGGMVTVVFLPIANCDTEVALTEAKLIAIGADGIAVQMDNVAVDKTALSVSLSDALISATAQPTEAMSIIEGPTVEVKQLTDEEYVAALNEEDSPNAVERLVVIGVAVLVLFAGILIALIVALVRQKKARPQLAGTQKADDAQPETVAAERYLSIRRGIQAGTRVKLEKFPFALGNSPANDLPLEDPSISAFHAKLFLNNDQVILVDLGNPIGTLVNGQTVHNQKITLKDGDVIKIGAILLSYSKL